MDTKLKSMLGLCIKSGKLVFGVDNIIKHSAKVYLVLIDRVLSDNSIDKLKNKFKDIDANLYVLQDVPDLVGRAGCKALGVVCKNFANGLQQILLHNGCKALNQI